MGKISPFPSSRTSLESVLCSWGSSRWASLAGERGFAPQVCREDGCAGAGAGAGEGRPRNTKAARLLGRGASASAWQLMHCARALLAGCVRTRARHRTCAFECVHFQKMCTHVPLDWEGPESTLKPREFGDVGLCSGSKGSLMSVRAGPLKILGQKSSSHHRPPGAHCSELVFILCPGEIPLRPCCGDAPSGQDVSLHTTQQPGKLLLWLS